MFFLGEIQGQSDSSATFLNLFSLVTKGSTFPNHVAGLAYSVIIHLVIEVCR